MGKMRKTWIKNEKEMTNMGKIRDKKIGNSTNKQTKDEQKMENAGKKCDTLKNLKICDLKNFFYIICLSTCHK